MSCDKSRIIAITICALMLFATACTGVKRTEPEPQARSLFHSSRKSRQFPGSRGNNRTGTQVRVYIKDEDRSTGYGF